MFWLATGIMTLAALGFAILPLIGRLPGLLTFRRRGQDVESVARRSYDIAIYADQLKALEAELERGEISAPEAQTARNEIERRILKAADRPEAQTKAALSPKVRWSAAVIIALLLPALGYGLYLRLGSPDLPDHPYVQDEGAATSAERAKNTALVEKLVTYMKLHPENAEGWMYLRQALAAMDDNPRAAKLLQAAVAARPQDVDLRVMLGESFVVMAEGRVSPAAKLAFEQAAAMAPDHPGPKYYLALAAYQSGDYEGAYEQWKALEAASPAGAPWLTQVKARLNEAAEKLGRAPEPAGDAPAGDAPAANAGPTAEQRAAVEAMSPAERAALIKGMVQKLADHLQTRPKDYDGWMRLGRAYAVLGDRQKAMAAYTQAQKFAPGDVQKTIAAEMALLKGSGK